MPHVFGDVPNLVNGVSQQAPSLRLPSQGEVSENYNATLLDGLTPRPNTNHLAKLLSGIPANAFTHIILRDDNEKYVLVITTTHIRVYDFNGVEQTVTNTSGTYLSGLTNPKEQLRALTVADHTFIVNKTKTVLAGTATEPARPHEALVYVMAGNYGKAYSITINGVQAASYQTPMGADPNDANFIDTKVIADALLQGNPSTYSGIPVDQLSGFTGTGGLYGAGLNNSPWAIGRYFNVIYITNSANDFTISTADGYSNRAMRHLKGIVQKFSDLPNRAPQGIVFEVQGDENTAFDNYWVKYNSESDLKTGIWKECVAPGTILGLNAGTMPHLLVRESNGTFSFKPATWDNRKCGNLEKVPHPSFVGQTIEDVFFHRNRLGFLTKENVVLSEAGKFYNFFRTTLTALLDSDPIDVAASHVKVSIMRHAVPYQDVLMLFSDQTQFKLAGNELLTPKTVNARPLSELPSIPNIRPVAAATSIYFVAERDKWASLFEYFMDKQIETADFDDVASHCPAYVPAGVHTLVSSPDLDIVLMATAGDPTAIYAYKFFYNGQEKLQSAWFKWTFPGVIRVVNMEWDKGKLVLLFVRDGDLYLERLDFEQRPFEDDGGFAIRLDRGAVIQTGVYDPVTDRTTFTLPYTRPTGLLAVTEGGGSLPKGVELTPVSTTSTTLVFEGNLSAQPIKVGLKYTARYDFSPFFYRGSDGKKAVTDGRLQILHLTLVYSKAAYFKVNVTPIGRATRTYTFTGRVISDPDNITGQMVVSDGKISLPILSRNDRVNISIVNDSWLPCALTSAVWQGTWNKASREL